jgi:hypothetical protein
MDGIRGIGELKKELYLKNLSPTKKSGIVLTTR